MCIKLKVFMEIILITRFFFFLKSNQTLRLDITREDSLRRFFVKHSIAMLEQCCNHLKQRRNNVATLCYSKNRCCGLKRKSYEGRNLFCKYNRLPI